MTEQTPTTPSPGASNGRSLWETLSGFVKDLGKMLRRNFNRARQTQITTELTEIIGGAAAITFGHTVLARSLADLDHSRQHELVHVRQYERWGPFFVPLYLLETLWAIVRRRHPYRDNRFEIACPRSAEFQDAARALTGRDA